MMKPSTGGRRGWEEWICICRLELGAAALTAFFSLAGCTALQEQIASVEHQQAAEHLARGKTFFTAGNYEGAFAENQKVYTDGQGSADVALFNLGLISAYSLNPKKDYPKALQFFVTLVRDYPNSLLAEQSRVWIHVLEEHQKIVEERRKLAETKRALNREREILSQEQERLKYIIEKSRQVDIEIEKRRRRTLMR